MASEKKRKRQSEGAEGSATKRVAFEKPSDIVKISSVEIDSPWQPVIANSLGIAFPRAAKFSPYTNDDAENGRLFLHSDVHPTLDYTASEESHDNTDPLQHYIGVYDSRKQSLELIPSHQMIVRSTLKSSRAQEEEAQKEGLEYRSPQKSARAELGLAFGTKKSKKAIEARAANAIVSTKPLAENKVATAILKAMPEQTVKRQDIQAEVDAARPIPMPNLAAEKPEEVYTISTLVGGNEFLAKIKAQDWIDNLKNIGDQPSRSIFVSRKVLAVYQSGDVKMMRVLRYLYLLICWFRSLRPGKNPREQSLMIPKNFGEVSLTGDHEQQPWMQEVLKGFGREFLPHLAEKFSEDGIKLTRWHQDKLIAFICALSLVLDGFETDTYNIQYDLRLDVKKITDYYKGLGCTVRNLNKTEIEKRRLSRLEAVERKKVILKCPVKLPQGRGFATRRK